MIRRGDPRLRKRTQRITSIDSSVRAAVAEATETLHEIRKRYNFVRGCGIAAPQIGSPWRFSVVEYGGVWYNLLNPQIIACSDELEPTRDGCLSFFDVRGMALRHIWVVVEYMDLDGKIQRLETHDRDFAGLVQHEVDHLDGILYEQRLAPGAELYPVPDMPAMP